MARNAKLNKFNLTHGHNTTMDMGYLYPVDFIEMLPGDIFKFQNEFLVRLMPMIAPLLNRLKVTLRWWYCPTRLLMTDWANFITGGPDGTDSTVLPTVTAPEGGWPVGSLADHFRIPTGVTGLVSSAFPFRMYDLVFNEWYRAEAIQDPVALSLASGPDSTTNTDLLHVNWRRDLYTDCLPSPQKGPSVGIGLTGDVPVVGTGKALGLVGRNLDNTANVYKGLVAGVHGEGSDDYHVLSAAAAVYNENAGTGTGYVTSPEGFYKNTAVGVTPEKVKSGLKALLGDAAAITINQLRQAAAVQQFQELNMRGGNRYVEFVFNQFGVRTPDASLQRPQYVGGMSANVIISEVLQTSETSDNSSQGNMSGHGIAAGTSPVIRFRALENGYLMCLMSIQPDTIYHQGLPCELNRETRFDFALPLLSHLGERGVKLGELFATGTDADKTIFGYLPRYEEYRRIPSAITGQLRTTLNYWTASRNFENAPTLNSEFIESRPSNDVFAVPEGTDHMVVQVMHHMKALRPLPKYGQPGLHII